MLIYIMVLLLCLILFVEYLIRYMEASVGYLYDYPLIFAFK